MGLDIRKCRCQSIWVWYVRICSMWLNHIESSREFSYAFSRWAERRAQHLVLLRRPTAVFLQAWLKEVQGIKESRNVEGRIAWWWRYWSILECWCLQLGEFTRKGEGTKGSRATILLLVKALWPHRQLPSFFHCIDPPFDSSTETFPA